MKLLSTEQQNELLAFFAEAKEVRPADVVYFTSILRVKRVNKLKVQE